MLLSKKNRLKEGTREGNLHKGAAICSGESAEFEQKIRNRDIFSIGEVLCGGSGELVGPEEGIREFLFE